MYRGTWSSTSTETSIGNSIATAHEETIQIELAPGTYTLRINAFYAWLGMYEVQHGQCDTVFFEAAIVPNTLATSRINTLTSQFTKTPSLNTQLNPWGYFFDTDWDTPGNNTGAEQFWVTSNVNSDQYSVQVIQSYTFNPLER